MSGEIIPSEFSEPFGPLNNMDHEKVALYAIAKLLENEGALTNVRRFLSRIDKYNNELVERLAKVSVYVEPVDDELFVEDDECVRSKTFISGACVALMCVDMYSMELGIPRRDWKDAWSNAPKEFDQATEIESKDNMTQEDCAIIGHTVVNQGLKFLASLEASYRLMLEDVIDEYPEVTQHPNIFKAGFGYAFKHGRSVVDILAMSRAADEQIESMADELNNLDSECEDLMYRENTTADQSVSVSDAIWQLKKIVSDFAVDHPELLADDCDPEYIESLREQLVNLIDDLLSTKHKAVLFRQIKIGGRNVVILRNDEDGDLAACTIDDEVYVGTAFGITVQGIPWNDNEKVKGVNDYNELCPCLVVRNVSVYSPNEGGSSLDQIMVSLAHVNESSIVAKDVDSKTKYIVEKDITNIFNLIEIRDQLTDIEDELNYEPYSREKYLELCEEYEVGMLDVMNEHLESDVMVISTVSEGARLDDGNDYSLKNRVAGFDGIRIMLDKKSRKTRAFYVFTVVDEDAKRAETAYILPESLTMVKQMAGMDITPSNGV